MTPEEAGEAVGGYAVARYASGLGEHGRGRIISYSIVPTFTIEREDGSRFSWRYDMCELIEPEAYRGAIARAAATPTRCQGDGQRYPTPSSGGAAAQAVSPSVAGASGTCRQP